MHVRMYVYSHSTTQCNTDTKVRMYICMYVHQLCAVSLKPLHQDGVMVYTHVVELVLNFLMHIHVFVLCCAQAWLALLF